VKTLVSPVPLLIAVIMAAFALSQSSNAVMWTGCLLALPAIVWIAGGRKTPTVLLWILGISWLQITADVFLADLSGQSILDDPSGTSRELAIIFSLCAMATIALGMRGGNMFGGWLFRAARANRGAAAGTEIPTFGVNRLILCYLVLLAITQGLGTLGKINPLFLQPIVIVDAIKYVVIYLIAITVFESEENYLWLVVVVGLEVMTGVIAYFASYKESIFVILIAMVSSRRPLRVRNLIIAAIAFSGIIWMSLVWTSVKREYRNVMFDMSFSQRINYMAETYFADRIDYHDALEQLVNRIGYTKLYARVIEMDQAGSLARGFDYYEGAIMHILTPRIIFPNKPVLDDSRATMRLLGMHIAEGTSIGVGYVTEAHVDFGFPALLIPMVMIGFAVSLCWQYFATRPVPHLLGEAFGVAALFNSFLFAANIDKSLGSFVTIWIAFAIILRFGYPAIRFVLSPLHEDGLALVPGDLTGLESPGRPGKRIQP